MPFNSILKDLQCFMSILRKERNSEEHEHSSIILCGPGLTGAGLDFSCVGGEWSEFAEITHEDPSMHLKRLLTSRRVRISLIKL